MNGMVSRRKFISMTMMMVVLLFMFQFTQAVKDMENDYNVNDYALQPIQTNGSWQQGEKTKNISFDSVQEGSYVAYLGDLDSQQGSIVQQWCTYTKRKLLECQSAEELEKLKRKKPEILLIDSDYVDFANEADDLLRLAQSDVSMVFCNLPDAETIRKSTMIQTLLGITDVEETEVELAGIKLFSGFLLGGEKVYQVQQEDEVIRQDLNLTIPWYVTFGSSKTYMVGVLTEETTNQKLAEGRIVEGDMIKNEYLPAIIWRNSLGDAKIFAINGDYMNDSTGIGILDAMMAELHPYELYPVVNAQNLTIANFPGFAWENEAEMRRIYSRTQRSLYQDIMWPAITALCGKTELNETLFFMAQGDYLDGIEPSDEDYVFYLKEIKEQEAEAGVSLENPVEGIELEEKINRDSAFYEGANDGYIFTSAYAGDAKKVEQLLQLTDETAVFANLQTVIQKYDAGTEILSYAGTKVAGTDVPITLQSTTSDGVCYTFAQDLRMRSLQTSLGYSNILLDMYEVAWPVDAEDSWEKMYDVFSRNINTFWKPFEVFEKTTMTESDRRVRSMLDVDFTDKREGNLISLQIENETLDCWFILRTHGEDVEYITGGEAQKLEDGAYLLHITAPDVQIHLINQEAPYYYIP